LASDGVWLLGQTQKHARRSIRGHRAEFEAVDWLVRNVLVPRKQVLLYQRDLPGAEDDSLDQLWVLILQDAGMREVMRRFPQGGAPRALVCPPSL
jgi:hypothetical protein